MYTINKDTVAATDSAIYVQPGIHENIRRVDIKYDKIESGTEFLAFYFENDKKDKLSFTEYPLIPDKPLESMSPEEKQVFENRLEAKMGFLRQFIIALTGKKDVDISATSFEELAKKVIKVIEENENNLVRVKVTYDNRGWATIPRSYGTKRDTNEPWVSTVIESMDIPKEETKIRITPFDRMERPIKDVERKEENPLSDEEASESNSKGDEVPF